MITSLYGGIIEIGPDGQPVTPDIILSYRSGEKQGVIQNVQSFTHANHMMSASEISFDVHKGSGDNRCQLWDEIKDFKLAYVPHLGIVGLNPWYELAVTVDEGDETIKHCQGVHVHEAELSQLTLNEFEVNTESDIARDDYIPTVLYNPDKKEGSLLHRILNDKASHYTVRHVAESLANKQRTFSWDGESIVDAFNDIAEELDCIFVYGDSTVDDGQIHRTISVYDLNDYCLDCGERGVFEGGVCTKCGSTSIIQGYGEDTGIFINYENFAEGLNYSSNKDSVKNCFRLVAGDDLMTATVRNLNPSGSQYIWHLDESVRADMSSELRSMLASYDASYEEYETDKQLDIPEDAVAAYNALADKYRAYDEGLKECAYPVTGYAALIELYYNALELYNLVKTSLAPQSEYGRPTSAQEQIETLTADNLSPLGVSNAATISATTVNSVLLNYAKVYIDTSLYKLSIEESAYSNKVWTGKLKLTSYDDEADTATTSTLVINITDAEPDYLRCQIEKAMKKDSADTSTMVELFSKDGDEFAEGLHHYSVDYLDLLANLARGCLDVLIEHGQGTPGATMYQSMYLKYYNKSELIQRELSAREAEIGILRGSEQSTEGILDYVEKIRKQIMAALDLRSYLGETLWGEFCSYRRDETYQNDNFISDGLNDAELIAMAHEFLEYARREIVKSATLQHTISCDLNNFLLIRDHDMPDIEERLISHDGMLLVTNSGRFLVKRDGEFSPLNNRFSLGNWLHIEIDDRVYKLRMTDYEIDYDNLQSIMVEFSDVTYGLGTEDDLKSVLSKAQSMASSYNTTQRQANKGSVANEQIVNMVSNGLELTNKRIVNSLARQTLLVDDTGMLMRAMNDYDDGYSAEQVKIINHGLYYTNDGWRTVQAGIGKFICLDPETGEYVEDYGLIARKIVGNIIIGNDLGIYTQNGSMTMNENGFTITTDATDVNQNLFTLRRKNGDGTFTRYIYVGNDGKMVVDGDIIATGSITTEKIAANAITAQKIEANAITATKIATDAITADKIIAGAITTNKIAANAVTTGKIAANAITADKIDTGAVTAGKIAVGAITAEKIAAGAITADMIKAGTMSADRISGGTIDANNVIINNLNASKIVTGIISDKTGTNSWNLDTGFLSTNEGIVGDFNLSDGELTYVDSPESPTQGIKLSHLGIRSSSYPGTSAERSVRLRSGSIEFYLGGDFFFSSAYRASISYEGTDSFVIDAFDERVLQVTKPSNGWGGNKTYLYGCATYAVSDADGNDFGSYYINRSKMHIKTVTATTDSSGSISLGIVSPEYSGTDRYVVISAWCSSNSSYICLPYIYVNYWYCKVLHNMTAQASTGVTVKVAYISKDDFTEDA